MANPIDFFGGSGLDSDEYSSTIVSFKCGKCIVADNRVSPDTRKGLLQLIEGDDGLIHARWKVRDSQRYEDDLIIINDAYMEKVAECTSGRVYALRFTSRDQKVLYWMQEPDASKDDELIKRFNQHAGGTPPEPQTETRAVENSQQVAQLRQLLRNFAESSGSYRQEIPLTQVLSSSTINSLLQDSAAVEELCTLLPSDYNSAEHVEQALKSPQIIPALQGLTQAIYTDSTPILSAMGVNTDAAATNPSAVDPMVAFAKALESKYQNTTNSENQNQNHPDESSN